MPKRSREDSPPANTVHDSSATDQPAPVTSGPLENALKYVQVEGRPTNKLPVMKCSLPPHREVLSFNTFEEFEVHYAKTHANRCSECRKNLPDEHFLMLHISENHDPLSEVKKSRGEKTYRCFIEDCDKVCSTPLKRRMHLADKHMFPKNYDFQIVNTGIDKRSSMLRMKNHKNRPSHSRADSRSQQDVRSNVNSSGNSAISSPEPSQEHVLAEKLNQQGEDSGNTNVDDITSAMSSLKFVPSAIRFGRGGRRGFPRP